MDCGCITSISAIRQRRQSFASMGLSGNAHNFDGLAPQLAARHHVLSLDVRGRGDSAWGPAADYNPVVYVADLLAFITELGLERVSLIGTSMGGIISMIFAGGYPERVERLVLNDIGPEIDPAGLKRITDYFTEAPSRVRHYGRCRRLLSRQLPVS